MTAARGELKNTGYEIFIGMLSVLSIVNLVLMVTLVDDQALQDILEAINALLSGVFMIDFIYRITTARVKRDYFFKQFGWADLIASLPIPQFKVLRGFRLLRVYRLMRELGLKHIMGTLMKDRAGSALVSLLLAGILVLEFGSLLMLRVEQYAPDGNIKSASDALWYVIVTISTVGYGDRYATTGVGRIVGTLIIVVGVAIFGTFTGYLANFFLGASNAEEPGAIDTSASSEIEQLKVLVLQQQAQVDSIERMLREQRN